MTTVDPPPAAKGGPAGGGPGSSSGGPSGGRTGDRCGDPTADRALGALQGLALGDALGMPTQSFSPAEIVARYGVVDRLLAGAPDQPIAPGLPAGTVTDDTEQALLLAGLLIAGQGRLDPRSFAAALADWQRAMIARGSLDLLGPSTRAAVDLVGQGVDPATTGRGGTTNGAAMRVAPVGIAVPPVPIEALVAAVEESCLVTHHTSTALAGAALVAGAVSAGIDGAGVADAIQVGLAAAELAHTRGTWTAGAHVADRTRWAVDLLAGIGDGEVGGAIDRQIGTSLATQESVVAAVALAGRFAGDPVRALMTAAGAGGDTDTIAAITGAVLGACLGTTAWPPNMVATVTARNRLDLPAVAADLLALRRRPVGAILPAGR